MICPKCKKDTLRFHSSNGEGEWGACVSPGCDGYVKLTDFDFSQRRIYRSTCLRRDCSGTSKLELQEIDEDFQRGKCWNCRPSKDYNCERQCEWNYVKEVHSKIIKLRKRAGNHEQTDSRDI